MRQGKARSQDILLREGASTGAIIQALPSPCDISHISHMKFISRGDGGCWP